MGVILDSSILIAAERRRFELRLLFEDYPDEEFFIAALLPHPSCFTVWKGRTRRRERESEK